MINYREKLSEITTFIFDFDGVLSDGKIWVMPNGEQVRATNVKDGYAMQYALKKGYNVAIISGGTGDSMRLRYQTFKGIDIFLGVSNKLEKLKEYCKIKNIDPQSIAYTGDDIPDIEIMQHCGLKCCPADACTEIKETSHYISHCNGGNGCVRDIIEQTLKRQGKWLESDAHIW